MNESVSHSQHNRTRNRANDLDGRTWCRYSISVWSDIRKTSEESGLKHPALFPEALPARLIECFTRKDDDGLILDPFAGMGSTLIAAARLGRRAVGIELSPEYVKTTRERFKHLELPLDLITLHNADAREVSKLVLPESVGLAVTSPPYWDALKQKRTADGKPVRDYNGGPGDLGSVHSYEDFLRELTTVFKGVKEVMRPGGYCCVVVMDIRKKNRFYPLHSDLARALQDVGYEYDDLIVWDRRQDYNNFRPLGYPSVFRINKAHEFIVILRRP